MLPGKKYSAQEIVWVLLRRRWLILLPLAVGAASAPLLDVRTPRFAFALAGAVGGLLLGLTIVVFLEGMNSTFRHEEDVVRVLALPVLAAVPVITSERQRQRQRHRRLALNLGAMLVLLVCVAAVVLWALRS